MNSLIFLHRDMTTCSEEGPQCTQVAARTFEAGGGKLGFLNDAYMQEIRTTLLPFLPPKQQIRVL